MTRIIAGYAGGRKLKVPAAGTRPTSDRAREGLFSALQARFGFDEARVLDLYAGSGALGLEAASRGAAHVDVVDNSAAAVAIMRENIAVIPEASVRVHQADAPEFVSQLAAQCEQSVKSAQCEQPVQSVAAGSSTSVEGSTEAAALLYDLVLADPPYAVDDETIQTLLQTLRPLLRDGAGVVVERSSDSPETQWPAGYEPTGQKLKRRTYGAARMDMARYVGSE